jgi:hypothetical protein
VRRGGAAVVEVVLGGFRSSSSHARGGRKVRSIGLSGGLGGEHDRRGAGMTLSPGRCSGRRLSRG